MTRTAFVTGGTRGIGKAIVQRLKEDGLQVAAGYSGNTEAAEATARELGVMVVKGNVGSFEDCARAVQEVADFAWATADNPRSEALSQIFTDMRAGVTDEAKIVFVEDRRRAISLALDQARPGDSLLIAGKGHETFQEFADTVIPFDDRQVVRELIAVKQLKP